MTERVVGIVDSDSDRVEGTCHKPGDAAVRKILVFTRDSGRRVLLRVCDNKCFFWGDKKCPHGEETCVLFTDKVRRQIVRKLGENERNESENGLCKVRR